MKKFIILVCLIMFLLRGYAQEFMHNKGIAISDMSYPKQPFQRYKARITQIHYLYFPKYIFSEKKNTSYSIGIPISVGGSIASNKNRERSAGAPIGLSCHIPVVLDYNIGWNSTSGNNNNSGGFFGLGIDYFTLFFPKATGINSLGPLITAGFNSHFRKGGENSGFSIGMFYKKGLESRNTSTLGLSFLAKR